MWLRVEHVTRFLYDTPVNEAYTEIRLKPLHRDGQRCSSFALATHPVAQTHDYRDSFGNDVHHFDVLEPHDELRVTATSEVWTPDGFVDDDGDLTPLDRWDLLRESRYVPLSGAVGELAAGLASGPSTLERALELMALVRSRMRYEGGTTDVDTRADEALLAGVGVCQDFAHILIGVCRAHGIPARYVSGYLYESEARETASHGWIDAHVEDQGWVSLDPTHDRAQDWHYVRVAVGRDYGDVPPTRGVYKGTATETLEVDVRIRSL